MSDITLTSGIRQNLLSLQQTSADLTTTQEALATGKAVNSAAENPSAYFTSQNLTNDANSLSSLLDQIGQGLQTIDEATNGLSSITSLLQQALSTVQQAQSDSWTTAATTTGSASLGGTAATTGSVELGSFVGGAVTGTSNAALTAADTLTIAVGTGSAINVALTSGETVAQVASAINSTTGLSGAVSATTNTAGDLVITALSGTNSFSVAADTNLGLAATTATSSISKTAATTLASGTISINVGTGTYNVAFSADSSLSQIESDINNTTGLSGVVTATDDGAGHLVLSSSSKFTVDASSGAANVGLTSAATATAGVTLNGAANTNSAGNLLINVGSTTYSVSIASDSTLAQIENDINTTAGLGASGAVTATDDGNGHLVLTSNAGPTGFTVSANATSASLGVTTNSTTDNTPIGSSTTRTTLQENYNGLLTQISEMAADSGYNGVNLLGGDNLTIDFNQNGTSSLTIKGVSYNAEGLGLASISGSAAGSFQDNNELSGLITSLNTALNNVQSQTETFGTNSSTISTRQTFTTATINTLQTGASNLVAADQNQESADLLTEQTQQQLEISALSIANQANQSVLKLFG
jgi:flagellin